MKFSEPCLKDCVFLPTWTQNLNMLLLITLIYWLDSLWVEQNHLEVFSPALPNPIQSYLLTPVHMEPTCFIGNNNMFGTWWFFVKILFSLLLALSFTLWSKIDAKAPVASLVDAERLWSGRSLTNGLRQVFHGAMGKAASTQVTPTWRRFHTGRASAKVSGGQKCWSC